MPLAKDVATELRKLADSLDSVPETEMPYAFVYMSHHTKESFLETAKVLPRPLAKSIDNEGKSFAALQLIYKTKAMHMVSSVPQSLTCTLVEPAKPAVYRCDPILSAEEDAALEAVNG